MIEDFYSFSPYELDKEKKKQLILDELKMLTARHRDACEQYANFLKTVNYQEDRVKNIEDIPFLPVRLFKELELRSISQDKIFKVMTSSGTTGQKVSKIYLDKETAMMQQKVMVKILGEFFGKKRLPMLIIDSSEVIRNRKKFSARGAAIIGLQVIAKDMIFALDENMEIQQKVIEDFLNKYGDKPFIVFGFTFMVWNHLYIFLKEKEIKIDLSMGYLMTGGGWKHLSDISVSQKEFKETMTDYFGITKFLDHYGMVEQTGCIYAECEYGHLHASIYSDIITRRAEDFSPCRINEPGIVSVVSVLPHSYPGHALLTEDWGVVLGEDDCPCGRKGKYIQILGRLKQAELRGCSDTYADKCQRG